MLKITLKRYAFRLTKEKLMYEKEAKKEEEKVEKMRAEGKDEYDIKKQVNTLFC